MNAQATRVAPPSTASLGAMILRSAKRYGDAPALRHKSGGRWLDVSYADLGMAARQIAGGLISLGVEPGDRVAILSNTRPEWTLADAGALCAAATVVPVYHTNSAEECRYVLGNSGARIVFCEDEQQLVKLDDIRGALPGLEHAILLTGSSAGALSMDELRTRGADREVEVAERVATVGPDDLATIVYSSGTTGPPKGCMLTHANCMATVDMYVARVQLEPGGVFFLFLPLAHVMARVTELFTLDIGGTLAYWQRDPKKLLDDLREAGPTHFAAVPRLFEKIYTAATAGVEERSRAERALFRWSLRTGRARSGPLLELRRRVADRLVLRKVRALFGPNLQFAISGAAPIAPDVLEFFAAAGVRVLEGYGMTETTAAATINTPDEWKLGSVGRAVPPSEVRIADDGELLLAGPNVFAGYYGNPQATAEALSDGWLLTGDLGAIDPDGFVSITGRKKDLIITSSGKNISPTNIENTLKESRWISEAVVYGDNRPYLVALLALDPDEAPRLADEIGADPRALARDERVRSLIAREVEAANRHFANIEQVKRFSILDRELSQAEGELTPTMKVKRSVVYHRYSRDLAALYR
jgi:long-chain acyl-CoA synthetase